MKLFGYKITKEKRNKETSYVVPTYNNALNFNSIFNNSNAMNISAVYRAVDLISDSLALLNIQVKENDEILESHPLNNVFKNGLNGMTKFNFIKLLIQNVLLNGNGYAFIERDKEGTPIGLHYLNSSDVTVNYNKLKNELYYTCNLISNKKIEPCNMIHLFKNSNDGIKGVSVISYANRSITLANNTENSAKNFFNSGCNLAGILTVQGQLTAQQRIDIKNSWNTAYSDGGNGLAVLQGNMDYKPVQLNSKDSQLIESRLFNVQDIARFFGISPVLLGELSHSGYATIEACQQDFLLHTLLPYIVMMESEFNKKLLKPSEYNLNINLDEDDLLRTDKVSSANYYTTLLANGILSINEVRARLGYKEIENGDKHFVAYTDINQNTINKQDKEDEKNL